MPKYPNSSLVAVRQRLLDGMTAYMDAVADCGYTQEDVGRCASILDACQASLSSDSRPSQAEIRAAIRQAVLDLNALTEECGHSLIETDQRECICEFLLVCGKDAGIDTDEDVTEEWRTW